MKAIFARSWAERSPILNIIYILPWVKKKKGDV